MKDNFKTIALLICGAVLMLCFSNNVFSTSQAEAKSSTVMPAGQFDHCSVDLSRKVSGPTAREIANGAAPNYEAVILRTLTPDSGPNESLTGPNWWIVTGKQA